MVGFFKIFFKPCVIPELYTEILSPKPMNKKEEKDKKKKISITIHKDLDKLIETYTEKENINKSKFIESIIKEHFKK